MRKKLAVGEAVVSLIQWAGQQTRAVITSFRAEGNSLFPRDSREQEGTHDPVTSGASTATCNSICKAQSEFSALSHI